MSKSAPFRRIISVLRQPTYGTYTAGNALSLTGTWMQRIAVGWFAWELAESAAWLGAVAFADLFPTVLSRRSLGRRPIVGIGGASSAPRSW